MVVAVTANFIPDALDVTGVKMGSRPSASFITSSRRVASYLPSSR
jgi:hypothetical protein